MKKIDSSAHWEVARGSVADNRKYCSKEGDVTEFGEAPLEQTAKATAVRKEQFDAAKRSAIAGDFDAIPSTILIPYFNSLKRIHEHFDMQKCYDRVYGLVGIWIHGPPGIGKSHFAREFCNARELSVYSKPLNKWWDGYEGEDVVLLEDVDLFSAKHMSHHLKIWADEYPFVAERKGGSLKLRPLCVFVTSNWPIAELWEGVSGGAIARRFQERFVSSRDEFESLRLTVAVSITGDR